MQAEFGVDNRHCGPSRRTRSRGRGDYSQRGGDLLFLVAIRRTTSAPGKERLCKRRSTRRLRLVSRSVERARDSRCSASSFTARSKTLPTDRISRPPPFCPILITNGMTLIRDFLTVPQLEKLITDSHFAKRDRLGRTLGFLARIMQDGWSSSPRERLTKSRQCCWNWMAKGRSSEAEKEHIFCGRLVRLEFAGRSSHSPSAMSAFIRCRPAAASI